jgi:hypothetical protein
MAGPAEFPENYREPAEGSARPRLREDGTTPRIEVRYSLPSHDYSRMEAA